MNKETKVAIGGIAFLVWSLIAVVCLCMWGCPKYNVYQQRMEGEAKLAEAESSRQISIREAKSKEESADYLKRAEIKRAEGVAAANKIIGDSLKGNESYLRYLWISSLEAGAGKEVIYVPTEAGLPILEAGKRGQ